jgi:hypothetical protein
VSDPPIPLAGTPAEDAAYLDFVAGCRAEHRRRQEHRRLVEAGRMLAAGAEAAGSTDPREYGDAVGEALEEIAQRAEVTD